MPGLMKQEAGRTDRAQSDRQPRPNERRQSGRRRGQNVTAEEQDLYDATVGQAYNLIYDDEVLPRILKRLNGPNPVESLATVAVMVMGRVEDSALKENRKIPGDVMLHAGMEVLQDLASLAAEAKVYKYDKAEKEAALYQALDQYRQMREGQGRLDRESLRRDWAQMMQAEQQGRLDEVLPGADKLAERARGRKQAGQQAMQRGKANMAGRQGQEAQ
jgi:hypothetical protein